MEYQLFLFFFCSSRRRHTRWNCDWSSDVCSSDLSSITLTVTVCTCPSASAPARSAIRPASSLVEDGSLDRKSVVYGKSVDLGGRRIMKQKNRKMNTER